MGRAPCCDKANVKKGPWSPEEDAKLKDFIGKYGFGGNWIAFPQKAGLKRCGKSCRLRWLNYLRPNIKHGEFSHEEDVIICNLYASIGSRWSVIASQLQGRTDNDIKNYWNTKLKKKLLTMSPTLQEKQSLCSSMPIQPSSYDHPTSHQFMSNLSSFHEFGPNFMNVDNTFNPLFGHDDHSNITNLQSSPPPPLLNNLMSNISVGANDNFLSHVGFQEDHDGMFESTSNSSEGEKCTSQNNDHGNYHNDNHERKQKYQIKQEDYQITFDDHLLGDHVENRGSVIKNHVTPWHNNLEEENQLNFTSYLFNDGNENDTTHYQRGCAPIIND